MENYKMPRLDEKVDDRLQWEINKCISQRSRGKAKLPLPAYRPKRWSEK